MRWLIFSILLLGVPSIAAAQGSGESEYEYSFEKRLEKYQSFWNKIIPTHTKMQYAGSMGFLSFGMGWDYGKKNRWETDLFFGFIPKYSTDKVKITMTLKQNYMPWDVKIGSKGFSFEPLSCGLYITTVFGKQFWATEPDYYPNGYYGFSTKFRINVYLGERITYTIPSSKRFFAKSITLYYELSSNELYIRDAIRDSYHKPTDYIKLSFGIKAQIF